MIEEYDVKELMHNKPFTTDAFNSLTQLEKFNYNIAYYNAINIYLTENFLLIYNKGASPTYDDIGGFYFRGVDLDSKGNLILKVVISNNSFRDEAIKDVFFDKECLESEFGLMLGDTEFCILNLDGSECKVDFKAWLSDFSAFLEEECLPPIDMSKNNGLFYSAVSHIKTLFDNNVKRTNSKFQKIFDDYSKRVDEKMASFSLKALENYRSKFEGL